MPPKSSKKAAGAGDSSSRSASTSALNHAAVPDGVSSTSIAATRPSLTSHYASGQAGAGSGSGLYAAVQPSMGGSERVKIWDVNEDRILADIEIPKAKGSIKGLEWTTTAAAGLVSTAEETGAGQKQGQKKRRRGSASHQSTASETQPCLIVAHDSEFAFYTLSSAKAVKTVPVEGGQIQVISKAQVSLGSETTAQILILASASHVHLTSLSDGNFLTSAQLPSNFSKPTALAVVQSSSTASGEKLQIVVASMQICALTIAFNADGTPEVISSQVQPSGVESIRDLAIIPTESESAQANDLVFASLEENSRSVSIWSFPSSNQPSGSPSIVASISSNSIHPLHALSIPTSRPILFLISSEGTAQGFDVSSKSLHPTSDEADASSGKKDKKKRRSLGGKAFGTPQLLISFENPSALGGIVQILPPSSSQADADGMDVDHTSLGGRVILGRAIGVNRIKWEPSDCIDSLGAPISTITLKKPAAEMSSSSDDVSVPLQRYRDPGTSGSTASALARAEEQALAQDEMELPVEGDMADMTLGERLAVLEPGSSGIGASKSAGKTQEEDDALPGSNSLAPQTAQSLTRMLLQALHTSDPQLLSLILTSSVNSTPVLVRNTVRRLPASMALPLLKACVDRLGKGKAFGRRGGGRGGGLNERQGTCVVAWIRGVLVERGSILMTIPSLPVHLASLSQLLNARLQLQSPLLSLSGRLDMAMAQIESRKEMAEASANLRKPTEYIEGESDSEDDEDALIDEVGIERAIEDGDIEDIGIESRSSRSRADVGSDQEMESGKSRKAKKAVKLALSDDEDEGDNLDEDDDDEEDDEEEDEDEDDFDEDEFDEDEEDEEGSLNGFIDDEAEEASDSESEIEEFN